VAVMKAKSVERLVPKKVRQRPPVASANATSGQQSLVPVQTEEPAAGVESTASSRVGDGDALAVRFSSTH
jgi:hypothetical protein